MTTASCLEGTISARSEVRTHSRKNTTIKFMGGLTVHERDPTSYDLIIQLSQHQHADVEKEGALGLQYLQKHPKEDKEAQKYLSEGLDLPH